MSNSLPTLFVEPTAAKTPAITSVSISTSTVLGVRFHCLRIAEAVDVITNFIGTKSLRQVCLANAYTVALARKDKALKKLLNEADLVLADGMSIVWGGRWIGSTIPERITGPDLMEALCAEAARKKYRIFLLGNTDDTLEKLSSALSAKFPELRIAGTYSPPFCDRLAELETDKILDLLRELQPDILFVSMSAPKQEKWIAENLQNIPVTLNIGVGAAFDFISEKIPRAPLWIQRSGLEWAHRLYCEPRRLWKRYLLGNFIFLTLLLKDALLLKIRPKRKLSLPPSAT